MNDQTSNKYLCMLRSESGGCEKPSPSEMEAMYARFADWQQKYADNILDMGGKLSQQGAVVRHDAVADGPFVEIKEILGGYMMLSAASLEEAIAIIQASPMVANPGTSIEIREISSQ